MNKKISIIISTLVLLGSVQCSFRLGKCPSFSTQSSFTLASYVGTWYEYARTKGTLFELAAECTTATYSSNSDGSIKVVNADYTFWKKVKSVTGKAECDSA